MKVIDGKKDNYQKWVKKNTDPFGKACIAYAERWAEALEQIISQSDEEPMQIISANAERAYLTLKVDVSDIQKNIDFMYTFIINILSSYWQYGLYLKKWHNEKYAYKGNGVIKPAKQRPVVV